MWSSQCTHHQYRKESHRDLWCPLAFFPDALPFTNSLRGIYSPEVCFYYPSAFLDSFIIYACLSKNILLDFVYFWMQEMNINGIILLSIAFFWHHITFERFIYVWPSFVRFHCCIELFCMNLYSLSILLLIDFGISVLYCMKILIQVPGA